MTLKQSVIFLSAVLPLLQLSIFAGEPVIIAHRGASRDAPGNTVPAFRLAWNQGADAIEGDFHLTKDGHIVCIHDENTETVSDTNLVVRNVTLAELRKLDVGVRHGKAYEGTVIPTIAEVLSTIPEQKTIYIEIKCGTEIIPALLREIDKSGLAKEQIAVISFKNQVIQKFKAKAPQYKGFLLCRFKKDKTGEITPSMDRIMHDLNRIQADGLFSNTAVPHSVIEAVRQHGYEWHAWTVNDLAEAKSMTSLGAKSIITDVPGYMKKHLVEAPAVVNLKPSPEE